MHDVLHAVDVVVGQPQHAVERVQILHEAGAHLPRFAFLTVSERPDLVPEAEILRIHGGQQCRHLFRGGQHPGRAFVAQGQHGLFLARAVVFLPRFAEVAVHEILVGVEFPDFQVFRRRDEAGGSLRKADERRHQRREAEGDGT